MMAAAAAAAGRTADARPSSRGCACRQRPPDRLRRAQVLSESRCRAPRPDDSDAGRLRCGARIGPGRGRRARWRLGQAPSDSDAAAHPSRREQTRMQRLSRRRTRVPGIRRRRVRVTGPAAPGAFLSSWSPARDRPTGRAQPTSGGRLARALAVTCTAAICWPDVARPWLPRTLLTKSRGGHVCVGV